MSAPPPGPNDPSDPSGPHPQLRGFLAQVGEGVAQRVLRLHHVVEVVGQRSGQTQHVLIFAPGVSQHLDLGLQLQVHGPGAPTEALRDHLFGTLGGHEGETPPEVPAPVYAPSLSKQPPCRC